MSTDRGRDPDKLRVMVVEDNDISLELVKDVLEAEGYEVLTASDGAVALEAISTEMPDLVLMDVQLPGLDGLEVTRRLKADARTSAIPIIALTAHAMRGDDESIVAEGCDGYISKPIKLSAFRELIAEHTRRLRTPSANYDV